VVQRFRENLAQLCGRLHPVPANGLAGGSPENLITVSTELGFWSEGSGEKDKAIKYYNEASGTFLDTWREYDFAKARLKRLKTPSG